TTENPSFEVISPLLSRARVMVLEPYSYENLTAILRRALGDEKCGIVGLSLSVDDDVLERMVWTADGDARTALNNLEVAAALVKKGETITLSTVEKALQRKALQYDKKGEEHYNLISALHKSMRGSDPDAALYWMGRMLEAGEDPLFILRRMIRFASEDVGNADPVALSVAVSALQAFQFIGLPEGELALAQVAVYLATAPKSNALYTGLGRVKGDIRKTGTLSVPLHIRNAPTRLMKDLGYGKGYKYAHNFPDAHVPQEYLPEELRGQIYYSPTNRGYEKIIKDRLDKWYSIRRQYSGSGEVNKSTKS
ncbi:MAG: replication-associated recombination protein A, partial [Thermodesulfobacteriota bacterium]|nr:replication-associated recombination protein A [Thermodesulfobacteriota bacterium]